MLQCYTVCHTMVSHNVRGLILEHPMMKILVSETHVQPAGLCKEAAERSCRPTGKDVFSHSADFCFLILVL